LEFSKYEGEITLKLSLDENLHVELFSPLKEKFLNGKEMVKKKMKNIKEEISNLLDELESTLSMKSEIKEIINLISKVESKISIEKQEKQKMFESYGIDLPFTKSFYSHLSEMYLKCSEFKQTESKDYWDLINKSATFGNKKANNIIRNKYNPSVDELFHS
jgi:hypothetical protein